MEKRTLAIIPARGGSKRLPRKNLLELNGKPLVCYSIDAAIKSGVFDHVMLNSDDPEILALGERYEAVEARLRPEHLAGDTVKVIDLIIEIASEQYVADNFNVIALLLPTCPFRDARDLTNGLGMLDEGADAVVSATAYEFPYTMSMRVDDVGLIKHVFNPAPLVSGNTRSQDHDEVYHPNGGFYFGWRGRLITNGNYFAGKTKAYIMPRLTSIDIDDENDFRYAEHLLQSGVVETLNNSPPGVRAS
ncbi:MAG: cytidylyltransferase domain-containing protein [Rhodospirillaceae bacterium]